MKHSMSVFPSNRPSNYEAIGVYVIHGFEVKVSISVKRKIQGW